MASPWTLLLGVMFIASAEAELCPIECDCDVQEGRNRAVCENQNIISVEIGVPTLVQVYDLRGNAISELDNFCFKELGYTLLQDINLSYNHIFWIGLHAFSELKELAHLDLSNNRLRSISSDLFWDTPLLEYLDLSGNVFETLKNEPFLIQTGLRVLNLSNCRIKALPVRMFTRLPNIRKLDLSENYMIGIAHSVFLPLKRLERLQLQSEFWKCTAEFLALEKWIYDQDIVYEKQCRKKSPKMSEDLILIGSPEVREPIDIGKVWNTTGQVTTPIIITEAIKPNKNLTMFERFDQEFSAAWAMIMGFEVGLVLGIIATYIWLRGLCKCTKVSCSTPQTPRQRRRVQRMNDNELRVNLLWNTAINPNIDTPPSHRRELALPDGYPQVLRSANGASEMEISDRVETPPPPYDECREHTRVMFRH